MNGKKIRLNKLKNALGFFFFLAADHKLSNGRVAGLDDISNWINLVDSMDEFSGIVLNMGSMRFLPDSFTKEIIPQSMGCPNGKAEISKTIISSVSESIQVGANCISTQLNFEHKNFISQVREFEIIRKEAHSLGIPILIMNNLIDRKLFNTENFINYLTYCSELGGDIIKINLPNDVSDHIRDIKKLLEYLPPVVLSGDFKKNSFMESVKLSKDCGFSGLCVGRNIFQDDHPDSVVKKICETFSTKT